MDDAAELIAKRDELIQVLQYVPVFGDVQLLKSCYAEYRQTCQALAELEAEAEIKAQWQQLLEKTK